ncbi:MAG: hypothetical protein M2R45_00767 [Verrucomicrobia subdivision 3 bacterium]|nr:hypothetical protein [Limisphaerales bacterium]MCS1413127.1 hypothetical protein [Limisphaerales bacterium]
MRRRDSGFLLSRENQIRTRWIIRLSFRLKSVLTTLPARPVTSLELAEIEGAIQGEFLGSKGGQFFLSHGVS